MKQVIAISGHAGSGKDTFAEMLSANLTKIGGFRVQILHYAWLLKNLCKELYGWDGVKDEVGRTILQRVGTDIVRAKDPDYWVSFISKLIGLFSDEWDFVIIPDTRFPNEIEDVWPDVLHIRMERNDNPVWDAMTEEQRNHPSASSLDGWGATATVGNNGDLQALDGTAFLLADWIMKNAV